MIPAWTDHCYLKTKSGSMVTLKDALAKGLEDSIDYSTPAELFPNKPFGAKVDHDAILLALSADKYPVALEELAAKLKAALS